MHPYRSQRGLSLAKTLRVFGIKDLQPIFLVQLSAIFQQCSRSSGFSWSRFPVCFALAVPFCLKILRYGNSSQCSSAPSATETRRPRHRSQVGLDEATMYSVLDVVRYDVGPFHDQLGACGGKDVCRRTGTLIREPEGEGKFPKPTLTS